MSSEGSDAKQGVVIEQQSNIIVPKPQELIVPKLRFVGPEETYKNELANYRAEQILPGKKSWEAIEKAAESRKPSGSQERERQARPRSILDKVHRQTLLVQARLEGVKDLGRFQELVDYFESTVDETESKSVKFDKGLAEEQKKKILEEWKVKGWEGEIYDFHEYSDDKNGTLRLRQERPLRLGKEHIAFMQFLTSLDNPTDLVKGLQKIGIRLSKFDLNDPKHRDKLIQFFSAPKCREVLELAQGISKWGSDWYPNDGSYSRKKIEVGQIDFLIKLAQSTDPKSDFPPEKIKKIDLLSRALDVEVNAAQIGNLQTIINNPDYLDFTAHLIEQGGSFDLRNVPILENILALDKAGVLKPLVELQRCDILVRMSYDSLLGKLFHHAVQDWHEPGELQELQQETIQYVRGIIDNPGIKNLLENPEKREFAGVIMNIAGKPLTLQDLSDGTMDKAFDKKAEVIYLLKFMQKNKVLDYYDFLKEASSIASDQNVMTVFTSKEFSEFLETLKEKTGYKPKRYDMYTDGRSYLADLFRNSMKRGQIIQDSTVGIIRALYPDGQFSVYSSEYYIRLAENPNMIQIIPALRGIGYDVHNAREPESIANYPDAVNKLSSPELKTLATRLAEEFKWEIGSYEITSLLTLYDDKELQRQLFTTHTKEIFDRLRKDFSYNSRFEVEDFRAIVNAPDDFAVSIGELGDKYKLNVRSNLVPLLRISADKKGFETLLETLANNGYQFKPDYTDIRNILQLLPYIEKLPETIVALNEVMDYKFYVDGIRQLISVLEGGFTRDRLTVLKQVYDKYNSWSSDHFWIDAIKDTEFIERNESTIARLESYNYGFKRVDIKNLRSLVESPDKESVFQALDVLRDNNISFYYNHDLFPYYVKLAKITSIGDKIRELKATSSSINLSVVEDFAVFVDLDADVSLYKYAKRIFSTVGNYNYRQTVLDYLKAVASSDNSGEKIELVISLITQINKTTSQELRKIQEQLLPMLLTSPRPKEALQQIEALFERNSLPNFAKKFRIFEILYATPDADNITRFDREIAYDQQLTKEEKKVSPVLRNASRLRRLDTIFRDLLKINIDSASPSLRAYLAAGQEGQALLDKAEIQGFAGLNQAELSQVSRFLSRLNVVYESSFLARQSKKTASKVIQPVDLQGKIASLRVDIKARQGQTILERVSEMFVKSLGYDSVQAVLERMDSVKQEAHQRNLSNPRIREGQLEIHAGDLLKGIDNDVLEHVLREGIIAREYLGVNADSDSTPFDSDVGMILEDDLKEGFEKTIGSSPAFEYGDTIILVRNRGQFLRTDGRQEKVNTQYDSQHYELFYLGVVDGEVKHFGIRTGFSATEIDAIIVKGVLADSQKAQLERQGMFFNIANNGFYIPIVTQEGKVIFTEADYNIYKLNKEFIAQELAAAEFKPKNLINLLKSSPYLKALYEMSVGVSEGHSLEQHTDMVMSQFEKYFSVNFEPEFLTKEDFRLMIAVHDIGKPLSVAKTGSTSAQHDYSRKVLVFVLESAGISSKKAEIMTSLIDQDILGEYIKGEINAQTAIQQINILADTLGLPYGDLLKTLKIFYISDAGSYTADAGGPESLDSLFKFSPEKHNVEFSPEIESKYKVLIQ